MYTSPAIFTPTPKSDTKIGIFAVMGLLNCEEVLVSSMGKKLPAKNKRFSISFWLSNSDSALDDSNCSFSVEVSSGDDKGLARDRQERTSALSLVWILLNWLSSILCGTEASPVFLELLLSWFNPAQVISFSDITAPVRVFMAAKRGSYELRCVRTLLSDAFPLWTLKKASELTPGFKFGKIVIQPGKKDLQILLEEGWITKPKYSRARRNRSSLDEAVDW
ncbi:unnamed protein product [Phytophthora fragariaefolia]|uniref:Unnamed protein product n=1 Tax=Phytophthora fragariaefolia TaxID=1490495 RepID=A0A9W6XMP1_9STRA|nr:unnamed protein product [Phytophthora fragariaefolia]